MSQGDNTPGTSRLAGSIRKIAGLDKDTSLVLDFGTINPDGSLTTNTFPAPIPKGDYLVCRCAALPNSETATTSGHTHTVGVTVNSGGDPSHSHGASGTAQSASETVNIARPSQAHIKPGDRVLVAWVQNDAIVIDVIVHANTIL